MMDFHDKIVDMIGDAETTYINDFNGRYVGKIVQFTTNDNMYCDKDLIDFALKLNVTDPYLIWNTPYYINGKSFELPLNINVMNKKILLFRVIVGPEGMSTNETQYLKINLHNCVYFKNQEWYITDNKSIRIK